MNLGFQIELDTDLSKLAKDLDTIRFTSEVRSIWIDRGPR
jgi:hypothetical protein